MHKHKNDFDLLRANGYGKKVMSKIVYDIGSCFVKILFAFISDRP